MKNSMIVALALSCALFLTNSLKSTGSFKLKYDSLSCLQIDGKILNSEGEADGAYKIELICLNAVVDSVILKDGKRKFSFVLNKNAYYAIRVSKIGYISKFLCVNTEIVGETDARESYQVYRFMFETRLMKTETLKTLNHDALDFPVTIIHYDRKNECFSYNKEYTQSIKKELHKSTPRRAGQQTKTMPSVCIQ